MPKPIIDVKAENACCDRLMKEGIEGRQVADAVARAGALTDLAVKLVRKDCISKTIAGRLSFLQPQRSALGLLQMLAAKERKDRKENQNGNHHLCVLCVLLRQTP